MSDFLKNKVMSTLTKESCDSEEDIHSILKRKHEKETWREGYREGYRQGFYDRNKFSKESEE